MLQKIILFWMNLFAIGVKNAKTKDVIGGYNTIMISLDEIRRNILWVKDVVDTKALPLMIELMKYGYEHCDVVILEGIMYDGVV